MSVLDTGQDDDPRTQCVLIPEGEIAARKLDEVAVARFAFPMMKKGAIHVLQAPAGGGKTLSIALTSAKEGR